MRTVYLNLRLKGEAEIQDDTVKLTPSLQDLLLTHPDESYDQPFRCFYFILFNYYLLLLDIYYLILII